MRFEGAFLPPGVPTVVCRSCRRDFSAVLLLEKRKEAVSFLQAKTRSAVAKKGNGEGSVHKLPNGRWRAQYYVETPKGRKRRSVSAASKQEARRLMMRGMYESQGIVEFDSATLTVGKYLRQWLESSAKSSVAPRTFANYELQVEQHLIPALGHLRLDKLTSLRIQTMYWA